jgi:hypothetical protein
MVKNICSLFPLPPAFCIVPGGSNAFGGDLVVEALFYKMAQIILVILFPFLYLASLFSLLRLHL